VKILKILAVPIFVLVFLFFDHVIQRQFEEREFLMVFGTTTQDRQVAQWAVNHQLRALTDATCESMKQLQVFPGDNYSLEVMTNAGLESLEQQIHLAKKKGFEVPKETERFLSRGRWQSGTPYEKLSCE
jgi:hypothetical protein